MRKIVFRTKNNLTSAAWQKIQHWKNVKKKYVDAAIVNPIDENEHQ